MIHLTILELYPKNVGTFLRLLYEKDLIQWLSCALIVCDSKTITGFQHRCVNFKWEQPSFLFQCLWLPKPWWLVFVGLSEISLVYRVLTASTLSLCIEGLINHCEDILAPHKPRVLWETELHQMVDRIPCCSRSSHLWVINVHLVVLSNAWCLPYYIKGRIFCVYVNSIYWTVSGFIKLGRQFLNTEREDICKYKYI